MDYLWCPADWTKGAQTEAAVRLERVKSGVSLGSRPETSIYALLCVSLVGCRATQQVNTHLALELHLTSDHRR